MLLSYLRIQAICSINSPNNQPNSNTGKTQCTNQLFVCQCRICDLSMWITWSCCIWSLILIVWYLSVCRATTRNLGESATNNWINFAKDNWFSVMLVLLRSPLSNFLTILCSSSVFSWYFVSNSSSKCCVASVLPGGNKPVVVPAIYIYFLEVIH